MLYSLIALAAVTLVVVATYILLPRYMCKQIRDHDSQQQESSDK